MTGCYGLSSLPEDLTISVEENTTRNEQKASTSDTNNEEDIMFSIEKVVITFCDEKHITLFYRSL